MSIPTHKEEIKIPASKAPVFKAGKALKDLVKHLHVLQGIFASQSIY